MNIKLWEIPVEVLKQTGLVGLIPLWPLAKDGARQEVVDEMITTLVAAGEKDLLALSELLGGLAFKAKTQKQWFRKRFIMHDSIIEESWVYQEWMQKGKLQVQRQSILDIVQERFPELVPLTKKQTDAIEDPEVLRRLIVKMGVVQTAQEAEQYLLSVAGAAKKN